MGLWVGGDRGEGEGWVKLGSYDEFGCREKGKKGKSGTDSFVY